MGKILKTGILFMATVVTAVSAVMSGCNTTGCTDMRSSIPRADFYDYATGKAISLDSLKIVGIGAPGDSMIVVPGEKISSVYLPLRTTADLVQWRIVYCYPSVFGDSEVADTLTFDYTPTPWFASEECGAMYRFTIHRFDYTRNLIDSVAVLDSIVTNTDLPTLNIYFRTEI